MKYNAENNKNLKYIMVQLPEQTNNPQYPTICEIGKERIRRAGKKILEENENKEGIEKLDIGFKVLKLDTSNLNAWDTTPIIEGDENQRVEELINRMNEHTVTLKKDRTELDVVFEVILKMGYEPTEKITEQKINGKKVFIIKDMLICLDKDIVSEDIKAFSNIDINKIVTPEESFKDSNAMSNAHYILNNKDLEIKLL